MSNLRVKFVSKKISKVRWRPQSTSVFITGSWDDEANQVCVWSCPNGAFNLKDIDNIDTADPQIIAESAFPGGVTDLKMTINDLIFASSTKGSLLIYKFLDQKLQLHHRWDNIHSFLQKPAPATAISVKGNDVATAGEDGRLCIFNFNKLQKVRQLESSDLCAFTALSYLRHQEIIVGNVLGYLKMWDLRSGSDQPSHTLMISGDQVGVISMNPHPMQPHILATGHEDGALCIWDLRHERRPATLLAGHKAAITDVTFHPVNPDYLYTCSMDGAVWQWNASALKSGSGEHDQNAAQGGSPWLSCDASKHRLDIISLFPYNTICVNSLDLNGSTLLWGTDSEALYIFPDIGV